MPDGQLILRVPKEHVNALWPTVQNWIEGSLAVSPPFYSADSIRQMAENGDYVMWLISLQGDLVGVAMSELVQYPVALVCNVPWIGGKRMPLWIAEFQRMVEQWGRDAGATHLTGGGRKGWARVAGMEEKGITLVKEI